MQSPVEQRAPRWLELALDYRCNLRCLGCHACHDSGGSLDREEVVRLLRAGRERGVEGLWLGGGEPTLRDDLLSLVRAARQLGYRQVVVQTNGMRLAYSTYRSALLAAGVTELRFNLKSHLPQVHDKLSGREGCHALLLEAIAGAAPSGVALVGDVLLTRTTAEGLADLVAFYAGLGVKKFVLWLLCAADSPGDASVASEVPRIADVVVALARASRVAQAAGAELQSLHTPPCTLPPELRGLVTTASDLALIVVGPDRRPFPLEASPFEGGAYLEGCMRCALRGRCGGPRADYLKIHGPAEFVPLPAANSHMVAR